MLLLFAKISLFIPRAFYLNRVAIFLSNIEASVLHTVVSAVFCVGKQSEKVFWIIAWVTGLKYEWYCMYIVQCTCY
jgi:hypothetical protein